MSENMPAWAQAMENDDLTVSMAHADRAIDRVRRIETEEIADMRKELSTLFRRLRRVEQRLGFGSGGPGEAP